MNDHTTPLPPLLLAFTGRAGAGKDTAAAYLEDHYAFTVIAFAEPLLDMGHALAHHADVDGAWLTERALKEKPMAVLGISYRNFARTVADALRRFDENFFARIAVHRARQAMALGSNVVITDLRYPNEAEALRPLGAQLVRITRPTAELAPVAHHSSEAHTDLLPVQHRIGNHGSPAALLDQLDDLMHQLRGGTA